MNLFKIPTINIPKTITDLNQKINDSVKEFEKSISIIIPPKNPLNPINATLSNYFVDADITICKCFNELNFKGNEIELIVPYQNKINKYNIENLGNFYNIDILPITTNYIYAQLFPLSDNDIEINTHFITINIKVNSIDSLPNEIFLDGDITVFKCYTEQNYQGNKFDLIIPNKIKYNNYNKESLGNFYNNINSLKIFK